MKKDTERTELGDRYAAAHTAHYETKDLSGALALYTTMIASHPESREAGYARSQVQNIVNSVVPKQDLYEAQLTLVHAHLNGKAGSPDAPPGPA